MKTRLHTRLLQFALILGLLTGGLQCITLDYAEVQQVFEKASAAENAGMAPSSKASYQTVSETLTDSYILKLDPKLRPNAWTLRATSEWRAGSFTAARKSAAKGLAAQPAPGSRDEIVLSMIDSLTIMTDLERKAAATGNTGIATEAYLSAYQPALKEAWTSLAAVERKFSAATPEGAKDYWNYQSWRFTAAWRTIISHVSDDAAADEAQKQAAAAVGMPLQAAGAAARARISSGSPYKNSTN